MYEEDIGEKDQVPLAASSWSKTTTDDLSISQNLIAIK